MVGKSDFNENPVVRLDLNFDFGLSTGLQLLADDLPIPIGL